MGTTASPCRYDAALRGSTKWINQCIADNKGGASDAVIRKYCFCMNEKMDANETRSITEWEKIQPRGGRARPGHADGGANARR